MARSAAPASAARFKDGQDKQYRGKSDAQESTRGREVGGIVLLGITLFFGISLLSFQFGKGALMGPVGNSVALGLYAVFGVASYLVAAGLGIVAVRCLVGGELRPRLTTALAGVLGGLGAMMLLHLLLGARRLHGHAPGGLLGEYGAELLSSLIGRIGTGLFAVVAVLCACVLLTPLSLRGATEVALVALRGAGRFVWDSLRAIFPDGSDDDAEDEADAKADAAERRKLEEPVAKKKRRDDTESEDLTDLEADEPVAPMLPAVAAPVIVGAAAKAAKPAKKKRDDEAQLMELKELAAPIFEADEKHAPSKDQLDVMLNELEQPKIVAPVMPAKKLTPVKELPKQPKPDFIPAKGGYHLPSLDMLDFEETNDDGIDRNGMLALADRLQKTLADYGVKGQVVQIHPGPVVTMYEFVPLAGIKIAKITSLSNDLAMSLEAMSIRIVAPIPGKGSVGIEVPNKTRAKVFLKEILLDDGVGKAKSKLTLGLGKDIAGLPVAVDLAKMPHLLVAGTTGSGKSVSVNGMICSVLFNATPDEVRMIMIDPKMVELSIYEGIPHLLLPVVTDPKKANLALKWAVDEMERRYELVSKSGVRDLVTYNKKVEKILADGPIVVEDKKVKIYLEGEDGERREIEVDADEKAVIEAGGYVSAEIRDEISAARALNQAQRDKVPEPLPRKLPYIIVVIDEFADLMMVAPKDVETSVARIAQKARAVGIHLILATQRPSVDVITGLIKANFPSRIAFQVASKIDSRTVLDQQGAESLLGQGDSLFSDRGAALRRIHGALVTEEEIKKLVDYLKLQGQPVYDMDILKPRAEDDEDGELNLDGDENKDEMYDQAVRLVCETRMASVSMIQRRLQVGFNRAARMVEQMEREGIVGAANGSKPREVIAQAV